MGAGGAEAPGLTAKRPHGQPAFRQARWDEPLIFELGAPGRRGYMPPRPEPELVASLGPLEALLPEGLLRKE
ncbi:hypothetical protein DRO60_00490, partial [Candidatus Bathyarchaeota archaeon]